ncbi:hypothetical protein D3C87_1258440 [compost metagenome]
MEHQRGLVEAVECQHFTDQDDVVAPLVLIGGLALEACRAAIEQRNVAGPALQLKRCELVGAAFGEAIGQQFLVGSQDVHGEVRAIGEGVCR